MPRSALPALNLLLVGLLLVVVVVLVVLSPPAPLALEELVFLCLLLRLRALPLPRETRAWPPPLPVLHLLRALPWRCSESAALPILSTTAPPVLALLLLLPPAFACSVFGVALECILSSVAVVFLLSLAVAVVVAAKLFGVFVALVLSSAALNLDRVAAA